MAVPRAAGAQAEVDLDAVVAAQRIGVEGADGAQAIATKIETGAVDRRQRYGVAGVGAREERVQRGHRVAGGQRVGAARQRIGRDADVVGERADDADIARRGMPRESVEPVVGDLGVRLQDHRVAIAMQSEGAIHRRGIALARGLLDDGRPSAAQARAGNARARRRRSHR